MSSKHDFYAAKSDMDDLDTIGDKLAQDLRKSIRTLVSFYSRNVAFHHVVHNGFRIGSLSHFVGSLD